MAKAWVRNFADHKRPGRLDPKIFANVYKAIISRGGTEVEVGKQLNIYSKNVAARARNLRKKGYNLPYPKGHAKTRVLTVKREYSEAELAALRAKIDAVAARLASL